MSNRNITDFTEGNIVHHLIAFSIPMLLGNFLQAAYNTVDSYWVGKFLGRQALAAVSVSFPIIFSLIALVMGLTMATTTLVSQYYGARRMDMVHRTISSSLVLLTILGILTSAAGVVFRRQLLQLVNVPPDVAEMSETYLGIFLSGLVAMFLYNAASAIFRGLGDSRTPLMFLAFATALNMILDPLFIFGIGPLPRMEVAGVALATVLAQAVSAALALWYLHARSKLLVITKGFFKLDRQITWLTFSIGLPAGVQQLIVSLSAVAVSSIVNSFGSAAAAAFGVGARLDQFATMPAMSVGLAVSALVGQNLGAGKEERVAESVKAASIVAIGISFVVAVIMAMLPGPLVAIFTSDPDVIQLGSRYLRILAFSYVPFAVMFTLSGVLRGAGDTLPTALISFIGLWLIRVPLARYLSRIPELGVLGAWIAIAVTPYIGGTLNYIYYKLGWWKHRAVVRRGLPERFKGEGAASEPKGPKERPAASEGSR